MNKFVIFLLTILIINACKSIDLMDAVSLLGKYESNSISHTDFKIELKENHRFTYSWNKLLSKGITHGTWELNKNHLILNSDYQSNLEEKYQIKYLEENQDHTRIAIKGIDGTPVLIASCVVKSLNGSRKKYKMDGLDTVINLPNIQETDKVHIKGIGFSEIRLDADVVRNKSTEILLAEYYMYFDQINVKIKDGKLFIQDFENKNEVRIFFKT